MNVINTDNGELVVFSSQYGTPMSLMRDGDGDILLRIYRDGLSVTDVESMSPITALHEQSIKAEVYLDIKGLTQALAKLSG